jgi:large subunit ribosomal protein L22
MAVSAKIKYLKISPRKVRLVADLIRNKPVAQAETILKFTAKKASHSLSKLLASAVANAKNNFKLDPSGLYVAKITVDGGPMQKRTFPRSRGRADMIQKKTSHVTIVLDEKGERTNKAAKAAVKKTVAAEKSATAAAGKKAAPTKK